MRIQLRLAAGLMAIPLLMAETDVDVAPFGRQLREHDSISVQWPEIRRIARAEITFPQAGAMPAAASVRLQYWHHSWLGDAIRRYVEVEAGRTGWGRMDDWYNGEWKDADTRAETAGRAIVFTFSSSEEKEYPKLGREGVRYRPTLKLRVLLPPGHPPVAGLRTYTDSIWRESSLRIQLRDASGCKAPLSAHNGRIVSSASTPQAGGCLLRARVAYASNSEDAEADRTIVTVEGKAPFSFAVDEVVRGDRIYVADLGALVTREGDPVTLSSYEQILKSTGARTLYDRVSSLPEQTLSQAWNDMPLKRPYYFALGCEGGRQRYRLEADGNIWVNWPTFAVRRPGRDNGRLLRPDAVHYLFGLPAVRFAERFIADGYLPLVTTRWLESGVIYEQDAFADVLTGDLNSAPPIQADDPTVAILRLRITNASPEQRKIRLLFSDEGRGKGEPKPHPFETLRAEGDLIMGAHEGRPVLRYLVDTRGAGALHNTSQGVGYELEINGPGEHTLYFKIPSITLESEAEIRQLRALDPVRERAEVAAYWKRRVAAGAQIHTPEPWLNDYYKAALTHELINNEREPGSDRYVARVGSFNYGAYGNESSMIITDFDRRGYFKEAERSLDLFLHYQGTVPLPGKFNSQEGVLYGAGKYEEGGYNQHHGWILRSLAEHYWFTHDRDWMHRVAPNLVAACRWVANQRKLTQTTGADGARVPEYGLLPAGSLEDVTDYWFWLSTNAFTWWGLDDAALALQDFGDPNGAALAREAESYRQDILAAYRQAMLRSPVVRLRDGTYVPKFPSNVYTRGRSFGWIRETLEGAIMLPITRLLDPASREAQWIMKDYEDNLYISDRFGYSVPVFDRFWFTRGGFSMQPNLLNGPLPYLYRDEIKQYLRAYFNPFAAGFDPTLRMLPEHPLPELGYFMGDHFKTSDEAQSAQWLRLMFIAEIDGVLHLGRALPRYWLKDGETIAIRNAPTYFGKTGFEIRSEADAGRISMTLDPPRRNAPRAIVVRFRHPEEKKIKNVTVNGARWIDFEAAKGDVRLPGVLDRQTVIVASY